MTKAKLFNILKLEYKYRRYLAVVIKVRQTGNKCKALETTALKFSIFTDRKQNDYTPFNQSIL